MTFAWGSTNADYRKLPLETLRQRYAGSGIVTRYYNADIHQGGLCPAAVRAGSGPQAEQRLTSPGETQKGPQGPFCRFGAGFRPARAQCSACTMYRAGTP